MFFRLCFDLQFNIEKSGIQFISIPLELVEPFESVTILTFEVVWDQDVGINFTELLGLFPTRSFDVLTFFSNSHGQVR